MNVRTCAVHCSDWPIVAACVRDATIAKLPIVVHERVGAHEVVRAASPQARALGIRIGMRRREAEACGSELIVLDADIANEVRVFEHVARAVEQLTPRIEVDVAGRLNFATRGPSRYFGGDIALCAAVVDAVRGAVVDVYEVRTGIADGRFAARLAARTNTIVDKGASAEFVAPFPVAALGDAELAAMLGRLGLPTLGTFGALPRAAVLARFGRTGARLHAMALGDDPTPLSLSRVPADCSAAVELDPPIGRVDAVAFIAKGLADRIVEQLGAQGLACTRILVEAETEHGEQLSRSWRHEEGFQAAGLAERVRWQLDGWLQHNAVVVPVDDVRAYQDLVALGESGLDSTTGALTRLRLEPEEVVAIPARQIGLFGGDPAAALRADRVLSRLQGMLGYESVGTLVQQGGRTADEQIAFIPWGEPRVGDRPLVANGEVAAWPGAIPGPAPARVFTSGIPAQLLDIDGGAVRVSKRGEAVSEPHCLVWELLPHGRSVITHYEGPWPSDVRWWDNAQHRRCVRWRVTTEASITVCVRVDPKGAMVEALYD